MYLFDLMKMAHLGRCYWNGNEILRANISEFYISGKVFQTHSITSLARRFNISQAYFVVYWNA